tara:strand:+ start:526 stop:804 length:279 start_codon:yes stop_codon:yes gene_type:complete
MNLENIPMKDANDLMKIALTLKSMVERDNKKLKKTEDLVVKLKDLMTKTLRAMKKMEDEKDDEIYRLNKKYAEFKTFHNLDDNDSDEDSDED